MQIVGRCPRSELIRAAIFSLLMLGGSGWFLYDGLVTYPQENLQESIDNLPAGWPKISVEDDPPPINPEITPEGVDFLKEGMKVEEVAEHLGPPGSAHEDEQRYFGPAGYLKITLLGELVKSFEYVPAGKHEADDIRHQLWIAVILLCIGAYALYRLIQLALLRTELSDEGLRINRRPLITWDDMQALDNSEYARKAWVYLRYTRSDRPGRIKLDSYRIDTFREMISELCSRKGFPEPFLKKEKSAGESAEAGSESGAE